MNRTPHINAILRKQSSRRRASHSLGITSLILGLVAFSICWIPLVNFLALPLAGLGLFLGVIGFIVAIARRGAGVGFALGGLVVSGLALTVALVVTVAVGKFFGDVDMLPGGRAATGGDIKVVNVDGKVTLKNEMFWQYAWRATVKNSGTTDMRIFLTIEFQDNDGFIVATDVEFTTIGGSEERTYTGTALVPTDVAPNIENVVAKVKRLGL